MTANRVGRAPTVRGPADFTSALYLGLRHPLRVLAPWNALTTGAPAALHEARPARTLARRVADLLGLDDAVVAPSTLHLFHDLPDALLRPGSAVVADTGLYPVGRLAAERAAARGARVRSFRHHDPDALVDALRGARRPLVLADGWCVACGRYAPLVDYARVVADQGGALVVDDTQGLGVFGAPNGTAYGRDGGGAARRFPQLRRPPLRGHVVVVASMAKAFGAPVAVAAGPRWAVDRLRQRGPSREHSGPASAAAVAAGLRALAVNAARGDALRARLAANVARFQDGLAAAGLEVSDSLFPVQPVRLPRGVGADGVARRLSRLGVQAPVVRAACGPTLTFLLTAAHTESAVQAGPRTLAHLLQTDAPHPR